MHASEHVTKALCVFRVLRRLNAQQTKTKKLKKYQNAEREIPLKCSVKCTAIARRGQGETRLYHITNQFYIQSPCTFHIRVMLWMSRGDPHTRGVSSCEKVCVCAQTRLYITVCVLLWEKVFASVCVCVFSCTCVRMCVSARTCTDLQFRVFRLSSDSSAAIWPCHLNPLIHY